MKADLRRTIVWATLAAVFGCGGGSSSGGGGTGGNATPDSTSYQAMLDACARYCEAYVAADCVAGLTVSECSEVPCGSYGSDMSAACHEVFAANWDCLRSEPDICAPDGSCGSKDLNECMFGPN